MNRRRHILTNSYVPHRAKTYVHDEKDLLTHFYNTEYNRILFDPEHYFENVKITNFDLMHNECRGDDLKHDRQYYETLFKKRVCDEIHDVWTYRFVLAAKRSKGDDVRLEKGLQLDHLKTVSSKERLKQKGICLSSMQKRKKCTDCCTSLPF